MLNEQIEFKEYSKLLSSKDESRLIPSLFFKEESGKKSVKCSGITRALTILARHYLFHNGQNYYILDEEQRDILRKEVRSRLEEWCFSEDDKKSGLYNYFKINEKNELWNDFKDSKEKVWTSSNIYAPINAKESYEFAINFSIIMAEAIYEGPLKVKYLKIKKDFEKEIQYQTKTMRKEDKTATKALGEEKKGELVVEGKQEDYRDLFLKQICACLMKETESAEFVDINLIDLANWMGVKSFASNSKSEQLFFFYEEQGLYEYKNKNCRINQKMIEDLGISLIDENEYQELKEQNDLKYVIYEDTGAGVKSLKAIT